MYWLPAIFWMAVIFYLSGRTDNELHEFLPLIDNFNPGHILAYFVLALCFWGALIKYRHRRPYVKAVIFSILYGVSDELHQYFVPTRQADVWDLVRDLAGTLLALGVAHLIEQRKKKSVKSERATP